MAINLSPFILFKWQLLKIPSFQLHQSENQKKWRSFTKLVSMESIDYYTDVKDSDTDDEDYRLD